jgi:DNA relaxase NicK
MAKKQTIASEIGSALGAVAARAEQLIANTPAKTAKPAAKRTASAKHSTTAPKKTATKAPESNVTDKPAEVVATATIQESTIEISREAVAEQAYLYYEARGYQGGDPEADWVRAEEELKQRVMAAHA